MTPAGVGVGPCGAGCVLNLFGLNLTWHLLVGVFVYGAATITWILTLKEMPLSIAYPAVSLSYVLVALLSTKDRPA